MEGLAELHTHLGGSVASDILWSLAHEQGIALPVKDFWEFDRLVTVSDPRGVAGIDIAGPRPGGTRYDYRQVTPMVEEARAAGLGVTIHVGEEGGDVGSAEIGEVVEVLRPDRIGHGILAAGDPELMTAIAEA